MALLARARRTDDQPPVIQAARAEVVESILEPDRETADVRFRGVVVDSGGVGSLTIDGREINFRQSDEGYSFDDVLKAVSCLADVLEAEQHLAPEYQVRNAVT